MEFLNVISENLLTPPILFFMLGILAGALKSDLQVPESISRYLSLYLMMAIGFKGGVPPLGYDVHNRKLEMNPREAEVVQYIFHRFIEIGSATMLVKDLAKKGYTSKNWVSRTGKHHQGQPITKSAIYKILCNQIYIGKISHKGTIYEGEHDGIIDPQIFEKVRSMIDTRAPNSSPLRCTAASYLLRGLVFDQSLF